MAKQFETLRKCFLPRLKSSPPLPQKCRVRETKELPRRGLTWQRRVDKLKCRVKNLECFQMSFRLRPNDRTRLYFSRYWSSPKHPTCLHLRRWERAVMAQRDPYDISVNHRAASNLSMLLNRCIHQLQYDKTYFKHFTHPRFGRGPFKF